MAPLTSHNFSSSSSSSSSSSLSPFFLLFLLHLIQSVVFRRFIDPSGSNTLSLTLISSATNRDIVLRHTITVVLSKGFFINAVLETNNLFNTGYDVGSILIKIRINCHDRALLVTCVIDFSKSDKLQCLRVVPRGWHFVNPYFRFSISLSVSLKYTELQFCLLFCMGVKLVVSH